MKTRQIGERPVSAIGLGAMPMSVEGHPCWEQGVRTIHAALDAGVTPIDTADADYTPADPLGHNESLVAEALSTSSADTSSVLGEANDVLGGRLVSVQNELSPRFRSSVPELELCDELGIAFLPWSPLGGISRAGELGDRHRAFAEVAEAHGVSPQQVTLAWHLAKSPHVVPIPGASRPETIVDSLAAVDLQLTADELARLDAP